MAWGAEKMTEAVTMKTVGKPIEDIHVMLDVPVLTINKWWVRFK